MPENIRESRTLVVREAPSGRSGRLQIGLITPGWGSSGYYSAECLKEAGTARVFAAGTQMFLDHPSETERFDRPERSVRDLAAVLTEDAVWDGTGLVAEAQVFGPFVGMLTDKTFAENIGVSIRAAAEVSNGEADGRRGQLITSLVEAISVDFVTKAGRGGQVLQVLESAREQVVERAVAHGVAEATANDTREALQSELTEQYGGERIWIWVRDFDDTTVWYQLETPDGSATYAEGYTIDDATLQVDLAGDQSEVAVRTQYVPVPADPTAGESAAPTDVPAQAGQPHPQESQEGAMSDTEEAAGVAPEGSTTTDPAAPAAETPAAESGTDSSQEGTMTDTSGAGGTAPARTPQRVYEARIAEERAENARLRARDLARDIVNEVLADAIIAPSARVRVYHQSMGDIPMVNGKLDEAALRDRVTGFRDGAEVEYAETAEVFGAGTPRGLGRTSSTAAAAETGRYNDSLSESLQSAFGLSKDAATIAVKGR